MFSVTAEANPSVRVDDIDIIVLNALNISIFPESKNEIKVQITQSLNSALHKYFSITEKIENEVLREDEKSKKRGNFFFGKSNGNDNISSGSSTPRKTNKVGRILRSKKFNSAEENSESKISKGDNFAQSKLDTQSLVISSKKSQEALYIKYMRVGDVIVEVSTAGFLLNTKDYKVCVDPFVLHGKVLDWGRLLYKVEIHTAGSVARHTASNWGSSILSSMSKRLGFQSTDRSSQPRYFNDTLVLSSPTNNLGTNTTDTSIDNEKRGMLLGSKRNEDEIHKRKKLGLI